MSLTFVARRISNSDGTRQRSHYDALLIVAVVDLPSIDPWLRCANVVRARLGYQFTFQWGPMDDVHIRHTPFISKVLPSVDVELKELGFVMVWPLVAEADGSSLLQERYCSHGKSGPTRTSVSELIFVL